MRRTLRDPVMALLTIGALTLALILMLELRPEPVVPVPGHETQRGDAAVELSDASKLPTLSLPPPDSFTEMVERPLFNPSRRPAQRDDTDAMSAMASAAEENGGQVRLVLTAVIIRGNDKLALLRDPGAGQVHTVRAGERVGSWSLAEVHADRVVLEKQGNRVTLALRRFDSGSGPERDAR